MYILAQKFMDSVTLNAILVKFCTNIKKAP